MRPSFITAIECESASASLWSCVTYTVVMRSSRCRRFSSKRIFSRSFASRLESGSSSRSSCGSMTSARPSARRCCCPPESLVASRSARWSSCTAVSTRITLSRTSWREYFRSPTSSGKAVFWNTFMCGQMAYDWNTMPKPRRLGWTKTPFDDEYTTRSFTAISPTRGFSRPAIERSVVVFPQPLGPSSVKSLPSGTSKVTSWAAFTISPCSFGYSVKRPSTLSTRSLLPSKFLPQPLRDHHQHEEREDEEHAQRGELDVLPVLPQLPDHDRHDLGSRAVEQDRARQLPDRHDHHVDESGHEAGLEQRQDDPPEGGEPRGAAHRGRLLELLVDLQHRGGVVAQPVRHEPRHVGDEHDPHRPVHADVDGEIEDHDRQAQHQARKHHRQRGDVVRQPASRKLRLHHDPADHRGDQHDHRRRADGKHEAVPDRPRDIRLREDEAVGIEREVLQRLPARHRIELLQRRPHQHQERQHDDQQEIDDEDAGGEPAPRPEIDLARPVALAGHGRVLRAAARKARLEK